jgi:hypothetical protein
MEVRNNKVTLVRLVFRLVILRHESYLHLFDLVVFAHSIDCSPHRRITPPSRVITLDSEDLRKFSNALEFCVTMHLEVIAPGSITCICMHTQLSPDCASNTSLYPFIASQAKFSHMLHRCRRNGLAA